jgi:tetratricopeptide (TPR) repeat protein
MIRILITGLSMYLLMACQPIGVRPAADNAPHLTPDEAIAQAERLVDEGRWGDAIKLLEVTGGRNPGSRELDMNLERMRKGWSDREHTLNDLILIYEADALQKKIPILEKLVKASPDSYFLQPRLTLARQLASSKVGDLLACGSFQMERNLRLAKLCLGLAQKIEPGTQTDRLAAMVIAREKAQQKAVEQQRRHREDTTRARQLEQLLEEAELESGQGNHYGAKILLGRAAALSPASPAILRRIEESQTRLNQQADVLAGVGDRLYREEQIEAAVAAWKSALHLVPDRVDIATKIKRALVVQRRLQENRRQQ